MLSQVFTTFIFPPRRIELIDIVLGMVGVGGLFIMGGGYLPGTIPQALGALSVLLAFVNVSGGFVITKRMLDMFKRKFTLLIIQIYMHDLISSFFW